MIRIFLTLILLTPTFGFGATRFSVNEPTKMECLDDLAKMEFGVDGALPHNRVPVQTVNVKYKGKTYAWDGRTISYFNYKPNARRKVRSAQIETVVWSRARLTTSETGKIDRNTTATDMSKILNLVISNSLTTLAQQVEAARKYVSANPTVLENIPQTLNRCAQIEGVTVQYKKKVISASQYKALLASQSRRTNKQTL